MEQGKLVDMHSRTSEAFHENSDGVVEAIVKKTAMGETYLIDTCGEKYILPSRRPDGTLRKQIKVKPGYVPIEEQKCFKTRHQEEKERIIASRPPGPPGWSPPSQDNPSSQGSASSKKKKNRQEASKSNITQKSNGIDTICDKVGKMNISNDPSCKTQHRKGTKKPVSGGVLDNWEDLEDQALTASTALPRSVPPGGGTSPSTPQNSVAAGDVSKRLRNLRKKLNGVMALEQKAKEGVKLNAEQLMRIERKHELEDEIGNIELEW